MSNMYPWVDGTLNFIAGECPHKCSYCYIKKLRWPSIRKKYSGEIREVEREFKRDLGKKKSYFVGSCFDMFAEDIQIETIFQIFKRLLMHPDNIYFLQTKNPGRYHDERILNLLSNWFSPKKVLLGCTIETNRENKFSPAYSEYNRHYWMAALDWPGKYISIEPIMDFDIDTYISWIEEIKPVFVSIGADSKKNNLPEPPAQKIRDLIGILEEITEVRIKDNLKRLMEGK